MARDRISQLYENRRQFPDGKNSEDHPPPHNPAGYHRHYEQQKPQDPSDWHDNGRGNKYDNDVRLDSWLRSGRATDKPGFDLGQDGRQAWRMTNKGNTWSKR